MGYDLYWVRKPGSEELAVEAAREAFNAACARRDALPKSESGELDWNTYKAAGGSADMNDHQFYPGRSARFIELQDRVHEAYEALYDAQSSYFRFNASGMLHACDIMRHTGMTFKDDDVPSYPSQEKFGVTWEELEAVDEPDDSDEGGSPVLTSVTREKVLAYIRERDRVLSFHGRADTPGIPEHKFSSNDGWLVLPAECEAAVRVYLAWLEKTGADAARDYVESNFGGRDFARWNKWVAWIGQAAKHGGFKVC